MNRLVSVCIPAYNRPSLIKQTIESILSQSYSPIEIIVGDDSTDAETEQSVLRFQDQTSIPIRYVRNSPRLGQNDNVNMLFDLALGDRLVLIHDDDYLLPNMLSILASCWTDTSCPVIAYGKQIVVSDDGSEIPHETRSLNYDYFRRPEAAGIQQSVLQAALLHQIPNNGFMALRSACQAIRYSANSAYPIACDYDFSIRLGQAFDSAGAHFVDHFTSAYRHTRSSLSNRFTRALPMDESKLFEMIESLALREELLCAKAQSLKIIAARAVKGFCLRGKRAKARQILFSRQYPWRAKFMFRGLYHAWLALSPIRLPELP